MPITLRKFNAQVRDSESGDMIPAGLLSSDALGAIESAKSDAVTAVEGKQAVAEAAVELKGQTTLASIPDDYTELSNEVDDVKTQLTPFALTMTDGQYVNFTLGIQSSSDWAISNNIPIAYGFQLEIHTQMYSNASIGFFDKNDNYISGIKDEEATGATGFKDYVISAPLNANYVRFSCVKTSKANAKVIVYDLYGNVIEYVNDTNDAYKRELSSNEIINDNLILASNGKQTESNGWQCTDFIDVFPSGNIYLHCFALGTGGLCFYDADKQPLFGIGGSNAADYGGVNASTGIQKLTIPYNSNIRYIRMSWMTTYRAYTSYYIEYRIKWNDNAYNVVSTVNKTRHLADFYTDKKVLVLGDSISSDAYGEYKKWVTDLIDEGKLSIGKVTNSSQHATGFVARYNSQANDFISRIEAIENKSSYDLVVVFGGINDYIQNIPLGGESGETDKTVYFKPAVDYFFSYLVNNFTQARICVLLPLRTYNIYPNTAGNKQEVYSDYIHTVAKSYCLPVLNLTEESGFCPFIDSFKQMWTLTPSGYVNPDGVHPTAEYSKKYLAPMIWKFISGLIS